MLYYERTDWYGFNYLLKCGASVIPHCLPFVFFSSVIAYLSKRGAIDWVF